MIIIFHNITFFYSIFYLRLTFKIFKITNELHLQFDFLLYDPAIQSIPKGQNEDPPYILVVHFTSCFTQIYVILGKTRLSSLLFHVDLQVRTFH